MNRYQKLFVCLTLNWIYIALSYVNPDPTCDCFKNIDNGLEYCKYNIRGTVDGVKAFDFNKNIEITYELDNVYKSCKRIFENKNCDPSVSSECIHTMSVVLNDDHHYMECYKIIKNIDTDIECSNDDETSANVNGFGILTETNKKIFWRDYIETTSFMVFTLILIGIVIVLMCFCLLKKRRHKAYKSINLREFDTCDVDDNEAGHLIY